MSAASVGGNASRRTRKTGRYAMWFADLKRRSNAMNRNVLFTALSALWDVAFRSRDAFLISTYARAPAGAAESKGALYREGEVLLRSRRKAKFGDGREVFLPQQKTVVLLAAHAPHTECPQSSCIAIKFTPWHREQT